MDAPRILRTVRVRGGLTQAELARRVGISPSTIAAYERGTRQPSLGVLDRLVGAAGSRLEVRLTREAPIAASRMTPAERAAAVVDVLLLADAIPQRRPAERQPRWPRMDSTRHRG